MKLRPEVLRFAEAMERKLRKNDYKSGWKDCDLFYLEDRLKKELSEFMKTLANQSNRMEGEAADVANFLMMLVDVVRWEATDKSSKEAYNDHG